MKKLTDKQRAVLERIADDPTATYRELMASLGYRNVAALQDAIQAPARKG